MTGSVYVINLPRVCVPGFIWAEIKEMWDGGFTEYIHDWWNLMDFAMNSLYLATISLKIVAYVKVDLYMDFTFRSWDGAQKERYLVVGVI